MARALRYILGGILGLLGLTWVVLEIIGSLVGVVTVNSEVESLRGSVSAFLVWLANSPPAAAYIFGPMLVAIGLTVLFWRPGQSWREHLFPNKIVPAAAAPPRIPRPMSEVLATAPRLPKPFAGPYTGASQRLVLFVVDYLLPAVDALFAYHRSLVAATDAPTALKLLMLDGIKFRQEQTALMEGVTPLRGLTRSPIVYIEQEDLERHIAKIERYYPKFAMDVIADGSTILAAEDANEFATGGAWVAWREAHKKLREAFDTVRRDGELKLLFRPAAGDGWPEVSSRPDAPSLLR